MSTSFFKKVSFFFVALPFPCCYYSSIHGKVFVFRDEVVKSVRDLQNAILQADLMPTEKLVGLCVAFHVNRRTQATRLRQATIAEECGLSVRSVKRAFKALREAGLLEMQATGRSPIIRIGTGNNTGNVEGPQVAPQRGHEKRKMPWEYDTEFSTAAEEQDKRERERLKREEEYHGAI